MDTSVVGGWLRRLGDDPAASRGPLVWLLTPQHAREKAGACHPSLSTVWNGDLGHMTMPLVWQVSRHALIPNTALKRNVGQLRPLGLAPALQKVAARALQESAPADLLPQTMNACALGRRSDLALVVMPLVERYRKMGDTVASICFYRHRLGCPTTCCWTAQGRSIVPPASRRSVPS